MTYTQFERRIYVTIGPLLDEIGTLIRDVKISLNLKKTNDRKKNSGTIKIYNLKNETIKDLRGQAPLGVTVEAGYLNNEGIVFVGAVMGMDVEYTGQDVILNIKVVDGVINTSNAWFSKSYGKETEVAKIVDDIINEMKTVNTRWSKRRGD